MKGTAASFAGIMILPRSVLGAPGQPSPNEELTKAVVGVGGMGQGHLGYPGARLLAICDVDSSHLSTTLEKVSDDVKGYHDFREVLERPDIDIIHVPTPPHWHALISIAAAEAGKDIWCEKPMSRTIGEGMKVVEAVQRNNRMFRLNTWFRFQSKFYDFNTITPRVAVDRGRAMILPQSDCSPCSIGLRIPRPFRTMGRRYWPARRVQHI